MTKILALAVVLSAQVALGQAPAKAAKETGPKYVTVGVVAALNDPSAKAQAAALSAWVKATLGRDTREQLFTDYEQAAKAVAGNDVHVAIMGPLAFLRIDPSVKATALVRMVRKGQSTYRAVLFAKPGSALTSFDALKKAKSLKVGWVDPSSATGYIVPKATLLVNGIDPVQIFVTQDFAGSHDAVCKGVIDGKWDVGATFTDDPRLTVPKATGCETALGAKAGSLVVLGASAAVPNDVLVASPAFSKEWAQKLVEAAKALSASDAGKKTLKDAFLAEGVDDVKDGDFEPLRKALQAFQK